MFEKEIERISKEFSKIVGDFKVSTQKAIIELKNEEMLRFGIFVPLDAFGSKRNAVTLDEFHYCMRNGTMDGYYANPFSTGSMAGWYLGDHSDYARIFN